MPIYGLYSFSFRDQNNINHSVEIWKDSASVLPPATIIRGDSNPFSVSMPGLSDKFQPVRGTGCQINLVSQTNMQFIGLYTARMQEYQIRHYINSVLNWCGWLDSELYTEPFDDIDGYTVSFSGSDGFALLDRMNYLQADGSKFTGISTQFDVLKFILEKLNIPLLNTYIYLSTAVTGATTTGGQTAFDVTHVMNANFYNEDGEPETLRKVLESILRPYGAFITQANGCLFITDVQQISTGSLFTMSKYTGIMGAYIDDTGIDADIGDISDIGISNMGQTFNVVPGINKQVVSFSPYANIDLIDFDAEADFSTPGTPTTHGTAPYRWTETEYSNSRSWTKFAAGKFVQIKGAETGINEDEEEYCLKNTVEIDDSYNGVPSGVFSEGAQTFGFKGQLPTMVNSSSEYSIKIEMSVYPVTKANLNDPTEAGTEIGFINLFTDLIIGGKKYNWHVSTYLPTVTNGWKLLADYGHLDLPFYTRLTNLAPYANIADIWTKLQLQKIIYKTSSDYLISSYDFLVPLENGVAGDMEFKIYGYSAYNPNLGESSLFNNLRIKDVKLTIVDSLGNDVSNIDLEYVSYLNAQYKEEGATLDLLQGTNTTNFPTCRGGLLTFDGTDYSFIQAWTRAGVTDIIENLLLRSYVGNYQGRTKELTAKVNRLPHTVGFLTYAAYLTGKFMLTSFTHNYEDVSTELTMQEIFTDSLTINKSF
jgi:hypothetical protein